MSNLSIGGYITAGGGVARVENALVELHAISGGVVATTFSRSNGEFEFANLRPGSYLLVVRPMDYEQTTQEVDLSMGSAFGLDISVQPRTADSNSPRPPDGRKTVTLRDLAVPEKAQEALAKGMTLLYQKSDAAGSVKQFQRAIKEYPDFADAYLQMGIAYAHAGDLANGAEALQKSIALGTQNPAAYWLLAGVLSDQKHFAQAEPLARRAVDLAPRVWQSNFELARALTGLNRAPDAERPAQAAVDAQPDNAVAHLELANVHGALQKYSKQLTDLNDYLRLDPTGPYSAEARTRRDQIEQFLAKNETTQPQQQPAPRPPK